MYEKKMKDKNGEIIKLDARAGVNPDTLSDFLL